MNTAPLRPDLRLTPTERQSLPRAQERLLNPLRLFVDMNLAAKFWFILFLLALALPLVERLVVPPRHPGNVIVLDAAGNLHQGTLLPFREATALHLQQAKLATEAFLNRTPLDFDNPESLQSLFTSAALAKAKAQFAEEAPERSAKQIHQKVEIDKIDLLQTRDDLLLIDVNGQILRVGSFHDQFFSEGVGFRLRLKMTPNPNLSLNGRFPTVVTDFRYETPS